MAGAPWGARLLATVLLHGVRQTVSSPFLEPMDLPLELEGFDLSDVEEEHLPDVINLLRSLYDELQEGPGGLRELRRWLATLTRICGMSAEATKQLCAAVTVCVSVPRQAAHGEPSRDSLQNAFVRMGGLKTIVSVLLLRVDDPTVVAACIRCLAAAVQAAPTVAESVLQDMKQVRVLLRAIERHQAQPEVAQQGCFLICNLCSQTPPGGIETAHRESQLLIASEGIIDLVMEILVASVKDGQAADPKLAKLKGGDWRRLAEVEIASAKLQEVALQALVVLTWRNTETLRLLASVLWCMAEQEGTTAVSRRSSRPLADPFGLPGRESRQHMGTLQGFARCTLFFAKLLKSFIFQDRPGLASKVCRLLMMFVDHQRSLGAQIGVSSLIYNREMELARSATSTVKLAPLKGPDDPFNVLEPLVSSLVHALATHSDDMTLVAEALEVLFHMKEMAMLSVPVGVVAGGPDSRLHWQNFMAKCLDKNELRDTKLRIQQALRHTTVAENRCRELGIRPSEISGDKGGVFLTPRLKAKVEASLTHVIELASDTEMGSFAPRQPTLLQQTETPPQSGGRGRRGRNRRSNSAASARVVNGM